MLGRRSEALPFIIGVVSRAPVALLLSAALLASCGNSMKSKEKVQAAVVERLQSKTGLNVSELDVNTTSVTFDKNMAYATVAIHPKGDSSVNHGMAVKYTLEDRDGKWVVVKLNSPSGNPAGAMGGKNTPGEALPPGHPSVAPGGSDALPNPHASPDAGGPNR